MSDCHALPLPDLLDALEARGVRLTVADGNLSVRPWAKLSEPEKERLRTDREKVVALLTRTEPEPAGPQPAKPEPGPEPMRKETDKERTLRRWRSQGPGAFTGKGRKLYAALLSEANIPDSELTSAEILLLREGLAARLGLPFDRRRG